jgi:hypothetical protein
MDSVHAVMCLEIRTDNGTETDGVCAGRDYFVGLGGRHIITECTFTSRLFRV